MHRAPPLGMEGLNAYPSLQASLNQAPKVIARKTGDCDRVPGRAFTIISEACVLPQNYETGAMNPFWSIGYISQSADIPILFLLFGALYTAFWFWMFIDCALHEPSEKNRKLLWLLVIFFAPFGSVIYYFVEKRSRGVMPREIQAVRQPLRVTCPHCSASVEESGRKCPVCGERLRPLGSV
jgi:hypothetical protein